jgi:glycosyltransferase involved in cell wall biosynthesis
MRLRKPQRVLYVDTGVGLAGGQRGLIELVRHLDREAVEPVIASPRGSGLEAFAGEMGIARVELPFTSVHIPGDDDRAAGRGAGRTAGLRAVRRLRETISLSGIDVVHANTFRAGLAAGVAARLAGKPMVFHDRTLFGHAPVGWALWVLASRIIVISRAVAAKYPRALARRLRHIPDMVDVERFKPEPGPSRPREPAVGYLGRISPEKGLIHLVRAAPLVLEKVPGTRFKVGGEAFTPGGLRYLEAAKREIETLEIGDSFEISGYVDDAPAFLAGLSVLALPSEAEGSGTVVLEAMAMERPVVAFDTGGQREIIVDGTEGRLVPGLDIRAFADAIAGILVDGEGAARMGRRGREKVVAHYSSGEIAARIVQVYEEVAGR